MREPNLTSSSRTWHIPPDKIAPDLDVTETITSHGPCVSIRYRDKTLWSLPVSIACELGRLLTDLADDIEARDAADRG